MPTLETGDKTSSSSLEAVLRRIDEISTLPQIALRVMEVAKDENSSAADLKDIMENDVALCARVLRCVNSSAYALRSKVTNLQQAITYLGLKQIRNLAMTASVAELFAKDEKIGPYRRRDLWRHLVAVGICARLIAMRRNMRNFDDAFLAGLLHDVGIVLEDQHAHAPFTLAIQSLNPQKSLSDAERASLGFDHTMLGAKLAEAWGFPEPVRAAIRHHHVSINYRGAEINIVRAVEVANVICTLKGISSVGVKLVKVCRTSLDALSLTAQDVSVLSEDLSDELTKNASLLSL
jgi:putative nucleotidyltransferase with HDIG domain